MSQIIALHNGSAYRTDFGTEYKSGKHSEGDTEHLTDLKSVVRYRSGKITNFGNFFTDFNYVKQSDSWYRLNIRV